MKKIQWKKTSDEKPKICDKCFVMFSAKESRAAHASVCAVEEKRHQCDGDYCCHQVSGTVETFTSHAQTQHGDSKMWTCPVCRLIVQHVVDLNRHMETHHTSDKTSVKFDETSVKFEAESHVLEEPVEPPTGEAASVKFEAEPYEAGGKD